MKILIASPIAFCLLIGSLAIADETQYYDCILRHLSGAKIDLAVGMLKQACNENYLSPSLSLRSRRTYNECLLENLEGVENSNAAAEIEVTCTRKHLKR